MVLIIFFYTDQPIHRNLPTGRDGSFMPLEQWLKSNGFKYHSLLMGKPRGGNYHWIDNHLVKATRYNGKFTELIPKKATIQVFDDEK